MYISVVSIYVSAFVNLFASVSLFTSLSASVAIYVSLLSVSASEKVYVCDAYISTSVCVNVFVTPFESASVLVSLSVFANLHVYVYVEIHIHTHTRSKDTFCHSHYILNAVERLCLEEKNVSFVGFWENNQMIV